MDSGGSQGHSWAEIVLTFLGWTDPMLLIACLIIGCLLTRPMLLLLAAILLSVVVNITRNPVVFFFPGGMAWLLGHAIGATIVATLVFVIVDTIRKYRAARQSRSHGGV